MIPFAAEHAATAAREDSVPHKYKQDLRRFMIGCYGTAVATAVRVSGGANREQSHTWSECMHVCV